MLRLKITSMTAVAMSILLVANTVLGYTMTTPTYNALVGTGPLFCSGSTGGSSTTGLTIIVKDGVQGTLGSGTAGPGTGWRTWSGTATAVGGTYPSPGQVMMPILYDSTLTPVCYTYCHT